MRYFLHMYTGSETIPDPEGAEFDDLEAAQAEALQSARDLIADQLRCGQPIPRHWQAQIATECGTVLRSISFATLIEGASAEIPSRRRSVPEGFSALYAGVRATAERSHLITQEIQTTVSAIRIQLRALAAHKVGE